MLARYGLRAPSALSRLARAAHGWLTYQLKHPLDDGTTHLVFEPLELSAVQILACALCGGKMRVLSVIEAGPVAAKILPTSVCLPPLPFARRPWPLQTSSYHCLHRA